RLEARIGEGRGTLGEQPALQGKADVLIGDLVDRGLPVIDPALAEGGQHRFRVLLQETQRRDEGGGSSHSDLPFAHPARLSSCSPPKPRSLPPWLPGQHLSDLQLGPATCRAGRSPYRSPCDRPPSLKHRYSPRGRGTDCP